MEVHTKKKQYRKKLLAEQRNETIWQYNDSPPGVTATWCEEQIPPFNFIVRGRLFHETGVVMWSLGVGIKMVKPAVERMSTRMFFLNGVMTWNLKD